MPARALIFRGSGPQVALVTKDNAIKFQDVRIGRDDGKFVEIGSGLDEGDRVALNILADYRKTVIAAVEEVNTSLVRYRSQLEAAQHLSKAVDASRRALDFHTGRYEHGISDFLNVLDAARQKYELEEQYAVARLAVVVAYIALYKALGGGWELYQEIPPIATPLPAVGPRSTHGTEHAP